MGGDLGGGEEPVSGQMEINFASWRTAADAFTTAAGGAPPELSSVVTSTTDPAACGAAGGLATVDGAVSIMLSVFGQVMQDSVVPALEDGLSGEAEALAMTGRVMKQVEDENADTSGTIGV